jgi:hypothetical protein
MKTLALAVLLSVAQVLFPVLGKAIEAPANDKYQGTTEQTKVQIVQLPPAWSPHKDKLDIIGGWAGIALAIAGIIGVCFAYRTLRTLQHQTVATREAAEAALLNAQAVINAERPWIVVTVEQKGKNFTVRGQNHGRTPAAIIASCYRHALVDDPQNLPIPPTYPDEGTVLAYKELVMREGPPFVIVTYDVETIHKRVAGRWARITSFEERLCLYGRVIYADHLSKDATGNPVFHETRWCYAYGFWEPDGLFMKDGPAAYNSYT